MVVCFFFVFLSLVEYVYINYLFYNREDPAFSEATQKSLRVMEALPLPEAEQVWLFRPAIHTPLSTS